MFRFRNSSAFLAFTAALAVGFAGCSGNRSVLPIAGPQTGGSFQNARANHARHGVALIAHQPPVGMQMAFLMTDGTVLAQSYGANTWYRYTPDATGDTPTGRGPKWPRCRPVTHLRPLLRRCLPTGDWPSPAASITAPATTICS